MDYYAARRATGKEKLEGVKGPVILVANHASHMDTPVILSALPRKLRKRTVVAAAADYFYKNRVVASLVSLIFNTVPIERHGGGGMSKNGSHLDKLLDQGWSLLLYPEGTRSRGGMHGSAAPRSRGAGGGSPPDDRADPGHRHRPGDAARSAVAEASARQAGAQAPPDRGLVRRADHRQRRPDRVDGIASAGSSRTAARRPRTGRLTARARRSRPSADKRPRSAENTRRFRACAFETAFDIVARRLVISAHRGCQWVAANAHSGGGSEGVQLNSARTGVGPPWPTLEIAGCRRRTTLAAGRTRSRKEKRSREGNVVLRRSRERSCEREAPFPEPTVSEEVVCQQ